MKPANFDVMARSYALLEKCTFGSALARCRFRFLDRLGDARKGLALGDGDGRFVARLLAVNQQINVLSVDSSTEMLRLQESRAQTDRLTVQQADVRAFVPAEQGYDLVVTHFFLDCLTQDEVDGLIERLRSRLAPGALWVISEFSIPNRGVARVFARVLVPTLYFGFRVLTGLRVTRVPNHSVALTVAGFVCIESQTLLGGILRSELWEHLAER